MSFCWTLLRYIYIYIYIYDGRRKFSYLWQCRFSKLSLLGNVEPSRYSPENFMFWEGYCLVWCSIFWGDWPLFLWSRGRQVRNSKFSLLHGDASHISGTGVAETSCWNADSLVSARHGKSSHCEDCNASPQRDVSSSRDLTKKQYWMACKIARSQRLRLLTQRISQEQGVRKETRDSGGLETEHQGRSGNNFSHHASTSDAELPKTLAGICWQGMSPHRHYIQEVNIAIKMLRDKDNFSNKFT